MKSAESGERINQPKRTRAVYLTPLGRKIYYTFGRTDPKLRKKESSERMNLD